MGGASRKYEVSQLELLPRSANGVQLYLEPLRERAHVRQQDVGGEPRGRVGGDVLDAYALAQPYRLDPVRTVLAGVHPYVVPQLGKGSREVDQVALLSVAGGMRAFGDQANIHVPLVHSGVVCSSLSCYARVCVARSGTGVSLIRDYRRAASHSLDDCFCTVLGRFASMTARSSTQTIFPLGQLRTPHC